MENETCDIVAYFNRKLTKEEMDIIPSVLIDEVRS